MDAEAIDPALRAATARVDRVSLPDWLLRRIVRVIPVPRLDAVTVRAHREDGVRLRSYLPEEPAEAGALLWVHGGGLLFGDARQDEALCGQVARELGVPVVSVNYRVGPRHPFPAPLDDLHTTWHWLQRESARLGIDAERVVVGGESAGGGLAAALVQRLHDEGGTQPVAQWLFAPMLDDRTAARTELDGLRHHVWDNRANRRGWSAYLPHPPGAPGQPPHAVAARRTDLAGLPPAYLAVGDIELFHDEVVAYARGLADAGVDVTLDVVLGAPHGFENWARDTAPARALLARSVTWLSGHLGRPGRHHAPKL